MRHFPPSFKKWLPLILAFAGVFLAVFLTYRPALDNDFVNWDDDVHLLKNPFIQSLDGQHIVDLMTTTVNKTYIPLTSLSFAVERHFFGLQPFVYHLNNVILHLLVAGLVLLFSRRLGLSLRAGVAAALLFGLHPIHVESVAWITERKDVLYSFFYMLALLSYCDYLYWRERKGDGDARVFDAAKGARRARFCLAATFVLGFLSLLAKPMALSLPLTLFLLDWFFQRKFSLRLLTEKIFLGVLFFPVVGMTYYAHARVPDISFPQSLLLAAWGLVFPLAKFFYPDYFVNIYKIPSPVSVGHPVYAFSAIAAIILLASLAFFRKRRLYRFAVLFYLFSIFFLLRWDPSADLHMVSDRFMYLPSLGFCLLLGAAYDGILLRIKRRFWLRNVAVGTGLIILALLIVKTAQQISVWRDGVTLWEHQLKRQQTAVSALAYYKLAEAKAEEPRVQEALERYRDGAESPEDLKAINEVLNNLQLAINIKPDYANAYYKAGEIFVGLGNIWLAKRYFQNAVRFDPGQFEALYYLGLIYQKLNEHDRAIAAFERAIEINPENRSIFSLVLKAMEKGRNRQVRMLLKPEAKSTSREWWKRGREEDWSLYEKGLMRLKARYPGFFRESHHVEDVNINCN